ncbi:MAG: hypothetical protein KAJ18_10870 [Candidatus Omnitrophica bacterium]|nr:hypothetical protein [Candidatus Omnitrophota bacterium]
MVKQKVKVWITAGFVAYAVLVYALIFLISLTIPGWMESVIGVLAIPVFWLIAPWMDLLRRMGLTEGEWIVAPSFAGYMLVVIVYAALLYVGLMAVSWGLKRFWK